MKRPLVAALLSALVFPGAGHLYLRRYGRACAFLVPALVTSVYLLDDVFARATKLADQVLSGKLALDPAAIAAQADAQAGAPWANAALAILVLAWAGSAIDAWLLARGPQK
ncbi:MAG: DUF6677 family protein [Pseudomonadota bacterium]